MQKFEITNFYTAACKAAGIEAVTPSVIDGEGFVKKFDLTLPPECGEDEWGSSDDPVLFNFADHTFLCGDEELTAAEVRERLQSLANSLAERLFGWACLLDSLPEEKDKE